MRRRRMRGLTLLDLLVVATVLAVLVYLVRLDWRRPAVGHRADPAGSRAP